MADEATRNPLEGSSLSGVLGPRQTGLRVQNERMVLTYLHQLGPLPKARIAQVTGLSAQAASVIMRALEADGLLLRGEPQRGRVGQPSVPMKINPDGAYFLGLKVGRRSVELVLTDFVGTVLQRELQVYDYPTPEATVAFAVAQITAIFDTLTPAQRKKVAGLGIAMPFFLWNWAQHLGVPQERMDPWRKADIRRDIAAAVDLPVFLDNDASAACGGELVFGPRQSGRDFLYFYVGYFIGGGVVVKGRVFTGRGNAGALGPMPVTDGSGRLRSLIDVASLTGLEERLRAAGEDTSTLWETTEGWDFDPDIVDAWLGEAAAGLAHAITAACAVVDFEAVRIDGWLPSELRAKLVAAVRAALDRLDFTGLALPDVQTGALGPEARALGAAAIPLSARFLIEQANPVVSEAAR